MDEVLKCTNALGVKNIYPGVLEADDVISWLSKNLPGKKIIVSVDNDFAQLVAPDISFYNPIKKTIVDTSNFEEQFNLTPKEYLYYKAIVGDVSDNINGIEGFGKVKGQRLAKAYAINQQEVPESYQTIIKENLKLVDLSYGLEKHPEEINLYKEQMDKLSSIEPNFNAFIDYCNDLEFNSIINDMDKWKKTFGKSGINQSIVDFCKRFE
jgi:DNA polymerase-1